MNCDVRWFIDFSSKKIAPFCKINFENQIVWCLKNARMWLKDFCDLRTSCFQSCLLACHMQKSHLYFSVAFNKACLTSRYIMLPPKLCEFGKTHIQLWGRSVCWTSALGHNRDLQHHCKLTVYPSYLFPKPSWKDKFRCKSCFIGFCVYTVLGSNTKVKK